jgi:hypothetical protein
MNTHLHLNSVMLWPTAFAVIAVFIFLNMVTKALSSKSGLAAAYQAAVH